MSRKIVLVAVLAGLISGASWAASGNESSGGAPAMTQGSRIDSLYCALVLALLSGSQGAHRHSALREVRMDSGSNETSAGTDETGLAAVYAAALAGHRTASGVLYEPTRLTAAHKLLPFGTRVRVTNLSNGKTVEVTITDRGPRQPGRVLDLSRTAASQLGIGGHGMASVRLTVLDAAAPKSKA